MAQIRKIGKSKMLPEQIEFEEGKFPVLYKYIYEREAEDVKNFGKALQVMDLGQIGKLKHVVIQSFEIVDGQIRPVIQPSDNGAKRYEMDGAIGRIATRDTKEADFVLKHKNGSVQFIEVKQLRSGKVKESAPIAQKASSKKSKK